MTRKAMNDMKTADKVLYICNREKCEHCTASEGMCQHTSDVKYAANFVKVDDNVYMETEVARLVPLNGVDAPTVEQEVYMTGEDCDLYMRGYNQARKDFERPQGDWLEHGNHIECDQCHVWFLKDHLIRKSFCPNCGAEKDCTKLHIESC